MIILGLTGSIAMGKTTVAAMFQQQGVPVISADDIVHDLYAGKAVPLIENLYPDSVRDNKVDRKKLLHCLQADPAGFGKLEALIHPLVREAEWTFIKTQKTKGTKIILLEIPLLFETGAETFMDAVIVVSAGETEQKKRALARPDMTEEKLNKLLAKQLPDAEKRQRADFLIETNTTLKETETQVLTLLQTIKETLSPNAFQKWKTHYEG